MRSRAIALAVVLAAAMWAPMGASAAQCPEADLPPKQMAERSALIFRGTVESSKVLRPGKWSAVRFSVERTWKGPHLSIVAVRVPVRGPCVMMPPPRPGFTYTVFATHRGDGFAVAGPASILGGDINPGRFGLRPTQGGGVPLVSVGGNAGGTGAASWLVWLAILGFIVLAVGGAFLNRFLQDKRRKEIAFVGAQQGLAFTRYDPGTGVGGEAFDLLHRGDGRGFENFLVGTWHETQMTEFDYWYYEESHDSKGGRHRTYYRFNCVVVPIPASCPHLTIGPEGVFGRLADHMGFKDIQFESDDFNRRFTVKCGDERFASAFVDQRMIQHLLSASRGISYEVAGDRAMVFTDRLAPEHLISLLGEAKTFRERVPRVVSSLYAPGGEG